MTPDLKELALRVLIGCVALTWLVMLWRGDRNPALANFSFLGLITTKEGYIDRVGVMEFGSWIALTLTLIVLVMNDKLTEWMVLIYAGLPAIRAGQGAYLRASNPPPASTTTTTETSTVVVPAVTTVTAKEIEVKRGV